MYLGQEKTANNALAAHTVKTVKVLLAAMAVHTTNKKIASVQEAIF